MITRNVKGLALCGVLLLVACSNSNISTEALPPPTLSINSIPANVKGASALSVGFSASAAEQKNIAGVSFAYTLDGTHYIPVSNVSGSPSSFSWNVPSVDASGSQVQIVVQDSRGLMANQNSNVFNILTTPPHITVLNPLIQSGANQVTFSGTCKAGDVIQYFGGLTPGLSSAMIAHYNRITAPECDQNGNWSLVITETQLAATFSYTLIQSDAVGNSTQVAFAWDRICGSGQYLNGQTCSPTVCTPASTLTDQTGCSNAGTRTQTCNANGSALSPFSACSCQAGYSGTTCNQCSSGFYSNGTACVAEVCTPGAINTDRTQCSLNGSRTETCTANGSGFGSWSACTCDAGYTGTNCNSCASGYHLSGTACVANVCTPSTVNSDSSGCNGNGTRTQSCTNGVSWSAWSSCTCSAGYDPSTHCASCLSGYYQNGSSCVPQACSPGTSQGDSTGCSNNGTRTHTCASNGSAWGSYGSCTCNTGYTGSTCSSCASGYYFNGTSCVPDVCTPHAQQTDTAQCSNEGTHSRTCAADGSSWGSYGTCVCNTGYMSDNCSVCSPGYANNGNGCVLQVCNPAAAPTNVSATQCSGHGVSTQSCASNGLAWLPPTACACYAGWTGSDCSQCDSTHGFSLVNGTCQQAVAVNYALTSQSATYGTSDQAVAMNLSFTTSSAVNPAQNIVLSRSASSGFTVYAGDTVHVSCEGTGAWPIGRSPAENLVVTNQITGATINTQTSTNESQALTYSFTATSGTIYNVDCHSSRSTSCTCNSGWTPTASNLNCTQTTTANLITDAKVSPQQIVQGDTSSLYYSQNGIFLDARTLTNNPFLITSSSTGINSVYDNANHLVTQALPFFPNSFWVNRVAGPNRISIKSDNDVALGVLTKTYCATIPKDGDYIIHVGADNEWNVNINGKSFASCTNSSSFAASTTNGQSGDSWCFIGPQFFQVHLIAGQQTIEAQYLNQDLQGAFWFELLNNSLSDLQQSNPPLNVISTTSDLVNGNANWDYHGAVCPSGYSLNACGTTGSAPQCIQTQVTNCN